MLGNLIFDQELPGSQVAVATPGRSTTWSELRDEARSFFSNHSGLAQRRVGLSFYPSAASYSVLAALDKLSCDVFLFDAHLSDEKALELAQQFRLGGLVSKGENGSTDFSVSELEDEAEWSGGSSLTILTSGSTGIPKAARHSWDSISRPIRSGAGTSPKWLLTYRPHLYAGLQVMLQCFADRGTLVIPASDMDADAIVQFMTDSAVEFVSATPSYWRRLLMFANAETLRRVPLKQITLGGEVIDQPILDKLKNCFPDARLVHIYATTELGRCFSVSDGKAGFPVNYLEKPLPDGTELRVRDGELQFRSVNSMQKYDPLSTQVQPAAEWFASGDMVEVDGDRVRFVGRRTEMINVGGSKVFPVEVESVIRIVPGVSDVRVFGKKSSIAGELVACEIVASPDQDREKLKEMVIKICRERLVSHQQPRIIKLVDRIDLSSAGKTLRTKTS